MTKIEAAVLAAIVFLVSTFAFSMYDHLTQRYTVVVYESNSQTTYFGATRVRTLWGGWTVFRDKYGREISTTREVMIFTEDAQ